MTELMDNLADLSPEQRELLALLLEEQGVELQDSTAAPTPLAPRKQPGEDAPLSFSQARLWFLDQLEPNSPMYNMPAAARIRGSLSVPALQASLDEIVARHEVLRTVFVRGEGGEPIQHVLPHLAPLVETINLTALPAEAQDAEVARLASAEVQRPFDLARGPLIRVTLLVLSYEDFLLLVNMHHIVTDGWSLGVFIRELGAAYAAFVQRLPSPLPALALQYGDYALWQRETLQGQVLEDQLAYWREALADAPAVLDLPLDRPRPAVQTHRGAEVHLVIPGPVHAAMNQLAQEEGATLFMTLLAAFQVFLYRYSRMTDICVGTPIANRTRGELEALIGFFTNTLVIRGQLTPEMPFRAFLRRVREVTLAAYENQDIPFEQIVEAVHPERSMSYSPLFQVMFALQQWQSAQQGVQLPGITLTSASFPSVTAKFDLTLNLSERGGSAGGITGSIEYNSDLFDRSTIERMAQNLGVLLQAAGAEPDKAVGELPVLTNAERELVVEAWNRTEMPFPDTTIHALIAEWAEATPDAIATEFFELTNSATGSVATSLTYRQIHERANQLAHHLQQLGVGPDTLVGLSVARSLDMIVGILGILTAGGAYLPLDPNYPSDRLAFMIADSATRILVTQAALAPRLPLAVPGVPPDLTVVRLDEDWPQIAQQPTTAPDAVVGAENLAYCIYTSGSTGRPKGTPVRHQGVCSLATAAASDLDMRPGQRMLQFAAFSFDASVWEITMVLRNGATLILASQETLASGPELLKLLELARVTEVLLPPAFAAVVEPPAGGLPDLRTVISGGDRVTNQMVQRWARPAKTPEGTARRFVNAYGPTEITVCATLRTCDPTEECPFGGPPIGRPVANMRCYVVDEKLQPQPVGVPGELLIAGVGVVEGYLNRPDLTAEKFVSNPFYSAGAPEYYSRVYRTGDLVRWLPTGEIEFLGRIDDQVKVRGFRIELGEIEAVLREHPAVQDAVLTARGETLIGYYIPRPTETGASLTATELRSHLRGRLPEYMVPALFVPMTTFPLSPANKVDRRRLPAPDQAKHDAGREYVAPRTPTEEVLGSVWAQLLSRPRVGSNDNFFDLGGHSLSATQLVSRVSAAFGVEMPLRSLFEAPTLSGLAATIDLLRAETTDTVAPPIVALPRQPDPDGKVRLPLSFAQQRLWFLDQLEPGGVLYNIPTAIRLTGSLDLGSLRRTLDALVRRHEALRTTFETIDGKGVQVIAPANSSSLGLRVLDLTSTAQGEREAAMLRAAVAEAQQPFDLARGPLTRVTLLKLADDDCTLLITMQHIISDGWSSGVVTREFGRLYAAFAAGEPEPELAPLPLQYADYASWQREWLERASREADGQGEEASPLQKQVAYWRKKLKGAPALLELPTDRPRPATASHRGAGLEFELPHELAEELRKISREEGVTLFMTLMAAFQTLLSRLTGQKDFCVGTPVANRTRGELESIVGFFVNTLVMRADVSAVDGAGTPTFRQLVRRVRTTALEAYAYQDAPFEKLIDGLNVTRDLSHSPLFQVMFVYHQQQGGASAASQLSGLTLAPIPIHAGTTPFDLTLVLAESAGGLSGWLEYATDLFDSASAEGFVRHFRTLLQGLLSAPDRSVSTIDLLTPQERDLILYGWNDTARDLPDLCLHEVFEQQATEHCNAAALLFIREDGGRREMSYGALDAAANALAHDLIAAGVTAEQVVAISVEKSLEQIVAMLAVLKAGGAYLPIDADYPQDRVEYMLRDSGARVLLTQSFLAKRFTRHAVAQVLCVDEFLGVQRSDWIEQNSAHRASSVNAAPSTSGAAYVIYTSGSTGRPKGVVVSHRGVVNFALEYRRRLGLGPGRRVLQFISFSFDASVGEMFGALLSGATLVLAPHDMLADPERLLRLLEDERIDFSSMPAAMLGALPHATASYPRILLSGGDACPPEVAARWLAAGGGARRFFNGYGPTEATVGPTMHEIADPEVERHGVAIGRPIANMAAYVLDEELQPVPPNVAGEIYLGGIGIARGYLGRPDLTADRFVPNPFVADGGSTRLYRTGDRGRRRRNGDLECLGRVDNQVKVRGYRVELGEIEAALSTHSGVRECAVVVRDTQLASKQLVAYFTSSSEPAPSVADLRAHLLSSLPDYMVPAMFVSLPALPLTANGKVDRAALWSGALPAPSRPERVEDDADFLAPTTPTEQALADIWSQVLGVRHVGVNDNFFELGGDSILSIQVVARANQAGLHLTPKQIFQSPTIAALAAAAGAAAPAATQEQGPVTGEVTLTPIQRYFFELDLANRNHWNQSVLLSVRQELDLAHLRDAIAGLIAHHDALRLRFELDQCGWRAFIPPYEPAEAVPFEQIDLSALPIEEFSSAVTVHAAEAQNTLDISRGPLIRAVYYVAGPGQPGRLLLVIHHLAVDGVSWRILLQDLQTSYAQLAAGAAVQLPPKTTSLQTWADQLAVYARSDTVAAEFDGWLERVSGWVPPLPMDFAAGLEDNTEESVGQVAGGLSAEETAALLTEANAAYNTEVPDLLLTALSQTIERWTGTPTLYVHLEGHGREELGTESDSADVSRTVGWFTSLYPVRIDLPWGAGESEAVLAVKEQLRGVPQHGLGYGLLRHLANEEAASALAGQPEPELSFNYLGQFDQVLAGGPENESRLGPASESAGLNCAASNRRAHLIDVTAVVAGGRLGVSWTYSRAFHDAATIQQVSDWYLEALRALIAHCRSPQAGAYSPSDFPLAQLDQKQLAKVLNKVKKGAHSPS